MNSLTISIRTALLALLLSLGPAPLLAQSDSAEVSRAVQRYIVALEQRDTAYIRAASLPRYTSISSSFPAAPGQTATVRTLDESIANLAQRTRRFRGRVWDERIQIAGDIAVYIAPYDAWFDGVFSHCGVDHYIFVRSAGRWLVSQLLFTVQREGCPPAPFPDPS